jgi:hypothetical protein
MQDKPFCLIGLTQDQFAIVDVADYEWLSKWRWHAAFHPNSRKFYAVRDFCYNRKKGTILMHRMIIGATPGQIVDLDTLNNTRKNLRIVTPVQSTQNRRLLCARNTTGFRGIFWNHQRKKWQAEIGMNGGHIYLGLFTSPEAAARAYDAAARVLHQGFSPLNFA